MSGKHLLSIWLFTGMLYFSSGQLSAQEMDEETGALGIERFYQSEGGITDCGEHIDDFEENQTQKHQNQNLSKHQTARSTSEGKRVYFTFRLGQGGFSDDRSPIGKLGGGQLTLDIKPTKLPIALSISSEYYTNSADPTHSYEIPSLLAINLLYMATPFKSERITVFGGGGLGWLEVPKGENEPDTMVRGGLYNLEGGINVRAFWKIGFYGVGKYLYAQKTSDGIKRIDFNENIVLLGITLNFGL